MLLRLLLLLCATLLFFFALGRLVLFHITAPGRPAHSLIRAELPAGFDAGVFVVPAQAGQRGFVELWVARPNRTFYDRLLWIPGVPAQPALPRYGSSA